MLSHTGAQIGITDDVAVGSSHLYVLLHTFIWYYFKVVTVSCVLLICLKFVPGPGWQQGHFLATLTGGTVPWEGLSGFGGHTFLDVCYW